jgi:hypothetical protein
VTTIETPKRTRVAINPIFNFTAASIMPNQYFPEYANIPMSANSKEQITLKVQKL